MLLIHASCGITISHVIAVCDCEEASTKVYTLYVHVAESLICNNDDYKDWSETECPEHT
jgi:hypothetical protein